MSYATITKLVSNKKPIDIVRKGDSLNFHITPSTWLASKPTNVCLPVNVVNIESKFRYSWNQKYAKNYGSLLGGVYHTGQDIGKPCQTYMNTGSGVYFNLGSYSWPSTVLNPVGGPESSAYSFYHSTVNEYFLWIFYLDNDLEETGSKVEVYDDYETFWTEYESGSGSYDITLSEDTTEKTKGASCLKCEKVAGTHAGLGIEHDYGAGGEQDWSSKEFFCFYHYGNNSGIYITISIWTVAGGASRYYTGFYDNYSGWKRHVIPLNTFDEAGTPDWSTVRQLRFSSPTLDFPEIMYFDRMVVDVGNWVKVEVFVPDTLKPQELDGKSDRAIRMSFYAEGDWHKALWWKGEGSGQNSIWGNIRTVNNIDWHGDLYDATNGCALYAKNTRGQTEPPMYDTNAGNITYSSKYGVKQRIGFALKLPPDDGQDASSDGISQCKIKIEVFYDDSGKTTYEFSDDTHAYTGLQNMADPLLLLLFNPSSEDHYLLLQIHDTNKLTALEICANKDDEIEGVEFSHAGEWCLADLYGDTETLDEGSTLDIIHRFDFETAS